MKAAYFERYGGPEVLEIRNVDKLEIQDNELLIRVKAATVTAGDVHLRKADPYLVRFFNGFLKPKRIRIPGNEFAGEVELTGKKVRSFKVKERVFGAAGLDSGTNAEYIKLKEDSAIAVIPDGLSFEQAASIPFGALASYYFIKEKARLSKGNRILIYGASGALGVYAVQIAKYLGAEVTGVCSTANIDLVRSLGADNVIDYTVTDFTEQDAEFDIIFDTVGKSPFWGSIRRLGKSGIYVRSVHTDISDILSGLIVNMFTGKRVVGGIANERKENLETISSFIAAGKLKPVIDRTYSLESIREAHKYVEKGHKKGSVVIAI
ncbi:MAG TPA: NAD(P)-dependent alcohol dehydrogenase [Ignavibacteria bacterium]|nr:NAD(P)-dependent alcohol dehydrogenase [Ignavibacteria bacterium]HMR00435.1 NAD(P)-dependent alcohol dehydrogenase [Ignavibacteria bacterium]